MAHLKTFISAAAICAIIFIVIMKYIFNQHGSQYVWIAIVSGLVVGFISIILSKKRVKET